MAEAAKAVRATCKRSVDIIDLENPSSDDVLKIKRAITNSVALIADLSESRPDVLYELGFANALGKKIVQICNSSRDKMPSTVRNNHTVRYSKVGGLHLLKGELTTLLKTTLP